MSSLGAAELFIIIAIVACMYALFKFGGRTVAVIVLGGLGLLFIIGLTLALILAPYHVVRQEVQSADISMNHSRFPEAHWNGHPSGHPPHISIETWTTTDGGMSTAPQGRSTRWTVGSDGPPAPRAVAEIESEVDPLVAGAATVDAEASSGTARLERPSGPGSNSTSRPAWLDKPAGKVGGGEYVVTTTVGPYKTLSESEDALAAEIRQATNKYIVRHIGDPEAARRVDLPSQFIMDRIVTDTWQEKVQHPEYGPMMYLHARLRFDDAANRLFTTRHADAIVGDRLSTAGMGGGLLLVFLSTIYGYLKLDTYTKGYYSGRLRVAAAAMILAVVAAGGLLVQTVIPS